MGTPRQARRYLGRAGALRKCFQGTRVQNLPLSSRGSSIWSASTSIRIRYEPTTSIIRTSCASISTRCPGCRGMVGLRAGSSLSLRHWHVERPRHGNGAGRAALHREVHVYATDETVGLTADRKVAGRSGEIECG
jgi:hypothetical protein